MRSAATRAGGRRERSGGPRAGRACFQHGQLPRSVSWVRHGPAPPAALTLCFPTAHEWVLPGWKPSAPRPPWAQPGAAAKGTRRERPPGCALLVRFQRSGAGCAIHVRPAGQTVRKAFREEPLSPTSHPPRRPSRSPVPGYADQRSTCIFIKHKTDCRAHSLASQSLQACSSWAGGDVP